IVAIIPEDEEDGLRRRARDHLNFPGKVIAERKRFGVRRGNVVEDREDVAGIDEVGPRRGELRRGIARGEKIAFGDELVDGRGPAWRIDRVEVDDEILP